MLAAEPGDRSGYESRQRGRQRPDPQSRALACCGSGKLRAGKLEALRDRVGMFEQDLPLAGKPEAAGPALQQPSAELALELSHLV